MADTIIASTPIEMNEPYNKVLSFFFSNPTGEFGLNDIVRMLKISKTTANRTIKRLEAEGFLIIRSIGKTWIIKSNQKHYYNETRKIPYNLSLIYSSGIIEEATRKHPEIKSLVLFGSYRKGDDIESSDIDIAAEILGENETKTYELGKIHSLGYRTNVKVNMLLYSRKRVNKNLFANIANGIVIHGFFEAKP